MLNKARQEFETEIIFAIITYMITFVILSELMVFNLVRKVWIKDIMSNSLVNRTVYSSELIILAICGFWWFVAKDLRLFCQLN